MPVVADIAKAPYHYMMKGTNTWLTCVNLSTVAGAITLCLTLSVPLSATRASSLTAPVRLQAQHLANDTGWDAANSAFLTAASGDTIRQQRNVQARDVKAMTHPLGAQTLSIEKQESKKQAGNALVRVYQFHYELQQARMLVVNPEENRVISIQQIASVHLPLNATEIAYATGLLAKQSPILDKLRDEQIRRGRAEFDELTELDVKASIYEPLDNQHPCHEQRCVLLSLFDATRTVFSTEPVINLQSLQVTLLGTHLDRQ